VQQFRGGASPDALGVVLEVRGVERLARDDLAHAAAHLEGLEGGHDDRGVARHARRAELDVEELLGAHVGAEPGLGDRDVGAGAGRPVGEDPVVAVGDDRGDGRRGAIVDGRLEAW
jgi:hypothetical protein